MELASSSTRGVPTRMPSGTAAKSLLPVARRSTRTHFRHRTPSGLCTTKRVTTHRKHQPVTCCTRSATAGGGDHGQPPETDPKLGTANESGDVSDSAGEEFPWACNSIPVLVAAEAKKRALELFSALKGLLGNNVELVIKTTKDHGTDVGISCRLDWKKTLPLWKGSSFYTTHTYQGRTFVSNLEAIAESITQSLAFRLIMMGFLGPMLNQMVAAKFVHGEDRRRLMLLLVLLLAMAASFVLAKGFTHDS